MQQYVKVSTDSSNCVRLQILIQVFHSKAALLHAAMEQCVFIQHKNTPIKGSTEKVMKTNKKT
jgi:hypothetical protein